MSPETPIPSILPPLSKTQRMGLKRRISTPSLAAYAEGEAAQEKSAETKSGKKKKDKGEKADKSDKVETRARSTSTSIVVPDIVIPADSQPQAGPSRLPAYPISAPTASTQPYPSYTPEYPYPLPEGDASSSRRSKISPLESVYNAGESSFLRFTRWIRPSRKHSSRRRGSDEDSEKGLQSSEEDFSTSADSASLGRNSEESVRRGGKYWLGTNSEDDSASYFSLPRTPSTETDVDSAYDFALPPNAACLPTPALSTRSLSRAGSKAEKARARVLPSNVNDGWLANVAARVWAKREPVRSEGKFSSVLRELAWTLALLCGLFVVTAATVALLVTHMPITQLKHLPKSTTDLQLLSAEIRQYMASSDVGYWHTVGVLIFIGCWKHAWSVPGAVVLNILVGSILDTFSAVTLLTFITATGSLFSYLLSRPLAPLITVLFPRPLALVRAALAPNQAVQSPLDQSDEKDSVTAIHVSADPASPAIGGQTDSSSVWRRLLIMRATGFVPWSGMNVACGVVEVDWKVFWLTTAAGSASWSYVTASVGGILSRLAIPEGAATAAAAGETIGGESLTGMLKDPYLIAKLFLLSGVSLIPVLFKGSSVPRNASPGGDATMGDANGEATLSPTSPLTRSLARFTPTPAVFDLLSFGRTAARQTTNAMMVGVRGVSGVAQRVMGH